MKTFQSLIVGLMLVIITGTAVVKFSSGIFNSAKVQTETVRVSLPAEYQPVKGSTAAAEQGAEAIDFIVRWLVIAAGILLAGACFLWVAGLPPFDVRSWSQNE